MPTYDFICPKCGNQEIHNVPYEERDSVMFTCSFCEDEEEILVRRTSCHGVRPEATHLSPTERGMMKDIMEYRKIKTEGHKVEHKESIKDKIRRNKEVTKLKYTKK